MSVMYSDGRPASLAMADRRRARGRSLTKAQCRRIRDMLGVLLVEGVGLSRPDAVAVLSMSAITVNHLDKRLDACPVKAREVFALLAREADGAEEIRLD